MKSKEGSITVSLAILIVIVFILFSFFQSMFGIFLLKQKADSIAKNIASSLATMIDYQNFELGVGVRPISENNALLIEEILKKNSKHNIKVEERYNYIKDNEFIVNISLELTTDIAKPFYREMKITSKSKFKTFLKDELWDMYLLELREMEEYIDYLDIDYYFEQIETEEVFYE